jgi:hypothetical protein
MAAVLTNGAKSSASDSVRASPAASTPTAGTKRKRANEQKFYAVREGKKPGIYNTWEECLSQVTGHKGASCRLLWLLRTILARNLADRLKTRLLRHYTKLKDLSEANSYYRQSNLVKRSFMAYRLAKYRESISTGVWRRSKYRELEDQSTRSSVPGPKLKHLFRRVGTRMAILRTYCCHQRRNTSWI